MCATAHRWRSLGFASPNFLGLRLICDSPRRRKHLTIWSSSLPIIIVVLPNAGFYHYSFNVAIVHDNRNRVCRIEFHLIIAELRNLFLVMLEPVPALTHIDVQYRAFDEYELSRSGPIPAVPDGFLGLPHNCNLSSWIPSHSLHFRNFSCLQLPLSTSAFQIFPNPGIFHPRSFSLAWPRCRNSNLVHGISIFSPIGDTRLPPSSPLSLVFSLKARANTWRP